MTVYAKRFQWTEANPLEITALLDAFVAQPEFLTYPYPEDVARQLGAHILTDPANVIWTSYCDNDLTGIILLQKVVPRVDATFHFLFLDRKLASKRRLLKNILGVCFTDYGFNRLTMEFPEGVDLVRFARRVLGFRYEGEGKPRNPELPKALTDDWVAKQGSRIEQGHFNGSEWKDIIRLRLLACEWAGTGEGEPGCRKESLSR